METLNLHTLVSETGQALMAADASDYYQRIFKTLGKQLLAYARIHETDVFSIDFGLQFLEDHYHMSEKVVAKKQTSCPFFILNAFLLSWMGKESIIRHL